jgi:nuclear transport factor 2 (NTF2) superfamily protein
MSRPPLPPFTSETAAQKARLAEDAWNTRRSGDGGQGLYRRRIASINDAPIKASERKYHWPIGRRPNDHPALSDFGS